MKAPEFPVGRARAGTRAGAGARAEPTAPPPRRRRRGVDRRSGQPGGAAGAARSEPASRARRPALMSPAIPLNRTSALCGRSRRAGPKRGRKGGRRSARGTAAKAEPRYDDLVMTSRRRRRRRRRSRRQRAARGPRRRPGRRACRRGAALAARLGGISRVVSEANELGGASARASRSARESIAGVPPAGGESFAARGLDSDEAYLRWTTSPSRSCSSRPSWWTNRARSHRGCGRPRTPRSTRARATPPRSYGGSDQDRRRGRDRGRDRQPLIWQWPNMVAIYGMLRGAPGRGGAHSRPPTTSPRFRPDRAGWQAEPAADRAGRRRRRPAGGAL